MKPVVSVKTMRESDAYTIKNFTGSKTLMYRAGEAVFKSYNWNGKTAIVCGSGNNAGDGYVLALFLKANSIPCTLFLIKEKFSVDGLHYFEKCKKENIDYQIISEQTSFNDYNQIVDCIFGTGFKGEANGISLEVINKINSSGKKIISVDINSGFNGDCGVQGECVSSDVTISIGYLKTGFFLGNAKSKIKKLVNCDIGIKLFGDAYTLIEENNEFVLNTNGLPVEKMDLPKNDNPIESIRKIALEKNIWIDCSSVVTNGKETYIFETQEKQNENRI